MAKITSFFVTLSLIFSYIFGLGSISTVGNYSLDSKKKLPSSVSLFTAQGLCCDGEYFYGSGAISALKMTCLSKFDLNMKCKKRKLNAVPKEFTEKYGSSHIGGIDCAGGYIYAPVEGKIDGRYKYNFILLFDCDTLEYTGIYYDMTSSALTDGIPWCAIDRENGFLYTSSFKNIDEILKYDLEKMEFLGTVKLQHTLDGIQGGS
ncbi:MAG: hypothetical protein K6B52_00285, partial [Clostridiales bacterium]|nr:hypothetical protein [Clostridiales bacterium]